MRFLLTLVVLAGLAFAGYRLYQQTLRDDAGASQLRGGHDTAPTLTGLIRTGARHAFAAFAAQTPPLSRAVPAANYHGAVHYGPGENLEVVDVAAIVNSRCDHLDIAMYSFTDWELAQAVTRFAANGRRVRIYRDRDQYEQESRRSSYVANLFHGNRNIAIRVKGSMILMHHKAWSDGCMLREGSANWSPSGEIKQDNTLTLTADSDTIRAFETNFQAMWARPDNQVIQ
jgi:phosphatidylserine/phosphatidylglycerophosphate/cardiolipin synthase-like enzyme